MKVFVAQTHERDRSPLCDFLKASGLNATPHATDGISLTWLTRELWFIREPAVIVTSQRDLIGCDYLSNILHAVALNLPVKTLTIVYSKALANQSHMPGIVSYLTKMHGNDSHQLKFVPKISDDNREIEHGIIVQSINDFAQQLTPV